jgi:prephenate dehydrogenase
MCEANAEQLLPVLDHAMQLLGRARDQLSRGQPIAELVEAGHSARIRYDSFSRPQIVGTVIGADGWRDELARAGRAGEVIRSALPTLGSRG